MKLTDLTYPIDEEIELSTDRVEHYRECIRDSKRLRDMDREALTEERAYLQSLRKLDKAVKAEAEAVAPRGSKMPKQPKPTTFKRARAHPSLIELELVIARYRIELAELEERYEVASSLIEFLAKNTY